MQVGLTKSEYFFVHLVALLEIIDWLIESVLLNRYSGLNWFIFNKLLIFKEASLILSGRRLTLRAVSSLTAF